MAGHRYDRIAVPVSAIARERREAASVIALYFGIIEGTDRERERGGGGGEANMAAGFG